MALAWILWQTFSSCTQVNCSSSYLLLLVIFKQRARRQCRFTYVIMQAHFRRQKGRTLTATSANSPTFEISPFSLPSQHSAQRPVPLGQLVIFSFALRSSSVLYPPPPYCPSATSYNPSSCLIDLSLVTTPLFLHSFP